MLAKLRRHAVVYQHATFIFIRSSAAITGKPRSTGYMEFKPKCFYSWRGTVIAVSDPLATAMVNSTANQADP